MTRKKKNDDDDPKTNHRWHAEWDGDEGEVTTGGLPDSFDPHDFAAVLDHLGYRADEVRMELIGASRWEQRSAQLDADGKPTGEHDTVWLNAYRYKAVRNTIMIDLPALYAEMAKGSLRPRKGGCAPPGDATVVVCWADVQTGKVDHQGGLEELLERLERKRDHLHDYLQQAVFDHIIVADVGDILEGFENTTQQQTTNCLSLMDQVDVAATEFWKTIRLCESFAPVDVLSIPSNHGQWRKGKSLLGLPTDDWGIHISKRLERQNEDAKLDVTFHRPGDWDETLQFEVRNTRLGLAHGHQARSPDKVRDWWARMTHAGVLDCHVLLTGHFHFPSLRPSGRDPVTQQTRWHIQASTLDNGSAWVRNAFGEDGDAALTVFQINNEGFDTGSFRLL